MRRLLWYILMTDAISKVVYFGVRIFQAGVGDEFINL